MTKEIRFRRPPSPEGQRNNSSATIGILRTHASAHRSGKRPDQGQADATAGDPCTIAASAETLEHRFSLIRWNSRSVVTNTHDNPLCIQAAADLHR